MKNTNMIHLSLICIISFVSCNNANKIKEKSLREWYVSDTNRKMAAKGNAEIQLILDGENKDVLIHKANGMNVDFVNSVLSDHKLIALYSKYKFNQLKFTNGSKPAIWEAKLSGDRYVLIENTN